MAYSIYLHDITHVYLLLLILACRHKMPHKTNQDWLIVCFGLNGPLRQYFSLYRTLSHKDGERNEMIDERKYSNNSHPHLQHHCTTRPPPEKQLIKYEHERHIGTTSTTEAYSLIKIFLTIYKKNHSLNR